MVPCLRDSCQVLERMLVRVVGQMVALAAGDADLQDELNAPDRNGRHEVPRRPPALPSSARRREPFGMTPNRTSRVNH